MVKRYLLSGLKFTPWHSLRLARILIFIIVEFFIFVIFICYYYIVDDARSMGFLIKMRTWSYATFNESKTVCIMIRGEDGDTSLRELFHRLCRTIKDEQEEIRRNNSVKSRESWSAKQIPKRPNFRRWVSVFARTLPHTKCARDRELSYPSFYGTSKIRKILKM